MTPNEKIMRLIAADLGLAKPAPESYVPTITFNHGSLYPSPAQIVDNVIHNKGGWKTLQQVHEETIAGKRAKAISDKYDQIPIPQPEFEEDLYL